MNRPAVHYFLGNALTMGLSLAGLVLFARLFTPAEYGRLSVLTATIGLLGAVGTLGLPQSAVRYYWEFEQRGELPVYSGTLLRGVLGAAIAVTLLTAGGSWLGRGWAWDVELAVPLTVTALVIGLTAFAEILLNFFRAGHASGTYSVALVLGRGAGLLGSLVAVVAWGGGVVAYLWGQVAGELLLLGFLMRQLGKTTLVGACLWGHGRQAWRRFDRVFFSLQSGTACPTCWPSSAGSCSAWGTAT